MKKHEIAKPIGMNGICKEIEQICNNARIYKCGLKPKHLVLTLSTGTGRTTFIEYMTDMYKEYGVLDFSGSLDDYVEVTIDGSSTRSISQAFAKIRASAVYKNHYSNVAALNIEDMAKYLNAPQFSDFIRETKELCRNAYVVFFVSGDPTPNEEKLIEKLANCIGRNKIYRAVLEAYTAEDICRLTEKVLGEHGVVIERYQFFHAMLRDMVLNYNIHQVEDAIEMAEELIFYADFSHFNLTVNDKSLVALVEHWAEKTKGKKQDGKK